MKNTLLFIIYISFSAVYAQTGTIKGSVTGVSGNPIVHAHIYLEKHKHVVASDINGALLITNVPVGSHEIHFSAVGFKSKTEIIEVKSGETTEANFLGEEKLEVLGEVEISGIRSITGMGYLDETHEGVIFSGKKTEVLLLDSLDANTAQNNPRQVLGRVPGANYSETEGSGFPSNGIGFRGLNPSQSIETNTRQNGYNITADIYGYSESYYLPPLEAVERIEVTRGESSLQFGPQFGGVINYIVKEGNRNKAFEYNTEQTGGSYGFVNSYHAAGGQLGKLNYFSFLQYQAAQGQRPNSDYRQVSAFGKISYQANKRLKLGVEYTLFRNRIHMPGGFDDAQFNHNPDTSYRARNWLTSPW